MLCMYNMFLLSRIVKKDFKYFYVYTFRLFCNILSTIVIFFTMNNRLSMIDTKFYILEDLHIFIYQIYIKGRIRGGDSG